MQLTKEEKVLTPELDMMVFHKEIYQGKEIMKIVGIRKTEVELEGDYSGGTHAVCQKDWMPIDGLFRLKKVCEHKDEDGSCPLHNLQCAFPECETYVNVNDSLFKGRPLTEKSQEDFKEYVTAEKYRKLAEALDKPALNLMKNSGVTFEKWTANIHALVEKELGLEKVTMYKKVSK